MAIVEVYPLDEAENLINAWALHATLRFLSCARDDNLYLLHVGNVRVFAHDISEISNDLFPNAQNKNGQQMGATVYSAGDVFVVSIDYKCLM